MTKVRITAKEENRRRFAVMFMGVKVAVAFDRDSGARVGYGTRMIHGRISSGGSRNDWYCAIDKGSVFELEVDSEAFRKNRNRIKKWTMEEISEFSITEERSILLRQIENNIE